MIPDRPTSSAVFSERDCSQHRFRFTMNCLPGFATISGTVYCAAVPNGEGLIYRSHVHATQQLGFASRAPVPTLTAIGCLKHSAVITGGYAVPLIIKIDAIEMIGYETVTLLHHR
jgi:hypothetical protein